MSNMNNHGGARPNTGVRYEKSEAVQSYDEARARNEAAKAELNEIEVLVKSKEYGSRAAFRQGCAMALAALAQTLRSVPDNLERRMGVSPEIAAEVGHQIDDALQDLATEFEMLTENA